MKLPRDSPIYCMLRQVPPVHPSHRDSDAGFLIRFITGSSSIEMSATPSFGPGCVLTPNAAKEWLMENVQCDWSQALPLLAPFAGIRSCSYILGNCHWDHDILLLEPI